MDHESVVRRNITESYLLGELDEESLQEFEDHFFACQDCARDVRAGALFVEQSKMVLAEESAVAFANPTVSKAMPAKPAWLAWLRPAFAAPALAMLLVAIGYQNLVTVPRLQQALNRPQVLPYALVSVGAMGAGDQVVQAGPEQGFVLFVRIPPDGYPKHTVEMYNPADQREWSVTFDTSSAQDRWPVQVPAAKRESGTYKLMVSGVTATGESKPVGQVAFDLQIQR